MINKIIVLSLLFNLLARDKALNAQVSVSGGSGLAASYSSLSNAGGLFSALNANPQAGNNVVVTITADLTAETGSIALNAGAWSSLLIKPAAATSPLISGNASTNSAVIHLNGADDITIDGSNNGTGSKDMVLRNTNANGSAIRFVNGATHNLFKNLVIESSNTASGTIFFSTDVVTTAGNSFNEVNNCSIRDRSDALSVPNNAVYSVGTAGAPNAANKVLNSELFDFNFNAVYVDNTGAGDGWEIVNNHMYEIASRGSAGRFIFFGGGNGHLLKDNVIGGSAVNAGGAMYFKYGGLTAIQLAVGAGNFTRVENNMIKNLGTQLGFGIEVTTGLVSITGNYLGAISPASGLVFYGSSCAIKVNSTSNCVISNNTVNNMANDLGGFQDEDYIGIHVMGSGSYVLTGNQVMNVRSSASMEHISGGIGSRITGIRSQSTGVQNISNNFIDSVGMTAFGPVNGINNSATGIEVWAASGIILTKNKIYNVYGVNTTGGSSGESIAGINFNSSGTNFVSNNMVSLNGGNTGRTYITGISFSGGGLRDIRLFHNSVQIYGTANGSATSVCIQSFASASTSFKNNLLSNNRTGNPGYQNALAIVYAAGWSSSSSDFNLFNNNNPAALLSWLGTNKTLVDFRAITGGDTNSFTAIPAFAGNNDLHLDPTLNCSIDGKGTPVEVTDDIDNQVRDAVTPDIGADEFSAVLSAQLYNTTGITACDNRTASIAGTGFVTASCNPMAVILPAGANPVTGNIKVCTYIDPLILPTYNAEPYVQRHYDIEPVTNASTATARVTLFFTDNEFEIFNANNGIRPDLPTVAGGGNSDPKRANLRVAQYHGAALTIPSQPNQYAAGTVTGINPADNDISWNGNYWEVSFDVNGFSGFYVNTNISGVLPITVNYFRGARQNNFHLLNWKVTCNSTPKVTLVLERSDASNTLFYPVYSIEATATRCNQPFDYTDTHPLSGMNYYRVKMTDTDGNVSYSSVVVLLNAAKGFNVIGIAPNPLVNETFKLNVTSATAKNIEVVITDLQGRMLQRKQMSVVAGFNSIHMNAKSLAAGSYFLTVITEDGRWTERFVK